MLLTHLTGNGDTWKIAPIIAASARILPQVIALYRTREGRWACAPQNAFLRCWLKHDRSAGLQAIERAANSRKVIRKQHCHRLGFAGERSLKIPVDAFRLPL